MIIGKTFREALTQLTDIFIKPMNETLLRQNTSKKPAKVLSWNSCSQLLLVFCRSLLYSRLWNPAGLNYRHFYACLAASKILLVALNLVRYGETFRTCCKACNAHTTLLPDSVSYYIISIIWEFIFASELLQQWHY